VLKDVGPTNFGTQFAITGFVNDSD